MTQVPSSPARAIWISLVAASIGGAIVGILAKLADTSTVAGVADLGTYLGLWVLLATVIAAWSPAPHLAAIRVGAFMLAMVAAYYVATYRLFGVFPVPYFLAWAAAALLMAPLFALLVWPSRRQGWGAAVAAALPIGLLLAEAFSFRWVLPRYVLQVLFDVAAAGLLLIVLPRTGSQRLRVLALAAPVVLVAIGMQRALPWVIGALARIGLRI